MDRSDARRSSGQNHIARHQAQRLAGKGNDLPDRINHLTRARLLPHFAVLTQFQRQIANVDIAVNEPADWRVGVERFAAPELFFRLLSITDSHVESYRV